MATTFAGVFARSFRTPAFSCQTMAKAPLFPAAARPSRILPFTRANITRPRTFTTKPPYQAQEARAIALPATAKVSPIWRIAGIGAVGLSLLSLTPWETQKVYCEPPVISTPRNDPLPPPPSSSVRPYELTFGTVCGVCAGVFIKKGARALAFVLGGVFVLLQYLGAGGLIKPNWSLMGQRFENIFYTSRTDPVTGVKTSSAPTIPGIWSTLVGFLAADFQQRASFLAGLALGLRIG